MLISPTHSIAGDVDRHGNINKELKMERKDLSLETVMSLQHELEEALEHHQCAIDVRDWNMVALWEEQIDIICEKIKEL